MDFPITSNTLLAYATHCAQSAQARIRQRLIDDVDTDPSRIRTMLEADVQDAVYKNRKKECFSIHIGNIRDTVSDFNYTDVTATLHNDYTEPLIKRYFPDAFIKIGVDYDIYIIFTLPPAVSDQTSNPSQ